MPAKKSKKTSSRSKRSTAKKSSRKPAKTRQEPRKPSFWSSLTLDRKLDILGISMVLVGLLTLLSLLSSSNGWLSAGWLALIGKSFGWGMYLLPVGLMALGYVAMGVGRLKPNSLAQGFCNWSISVLHLLNLLKRV